MKGSYTEEIDESSLPFREIVSNILHQPAAGTWSAAQFCDDAEGTIVRYHVYKITMDGAAFVLKRSDPAEISIYENLLEKHSFPVPKYFGKTQWNGRSWILIEFIPGHDLRDFTEDMAHACAGSVASIMNAYWQSTEADFQAQKVDNRFQRYWDRIQRRAKCLENEPELKAAYQKFLERQLTCPRTLCNGDFLQYNGIYNQHQVFLIDWAFGGIMPYSLDIARLIAHGTENKCTFPFYMNDSLREIYIQDLYDLLLCKPGEKQYLQDIRLSLLNEYIEFIESDLIDKTLDPADYYYQKAGELARFINR